MGVYENARPPNIDPQIVGFPYNRDPNKVPLFAEMVVDDCALEQRRETQLKTA